MTEIVPVRYKEYRTFELHLTTNSVCDGYKWSGQYTWEVWVIADHWVKNHPFYSGAKWTYAYSTPLHDAGPVGFNEADLRLWNWLCWFFGAELLHGVVVFLLVFSHQQLQRTAGLCTKKQKNNFIKVYLRQTAHNYYKQRLHSEIDQAYILKSSRKPRMFTRLGL